MLRIASILITSVVLVLSGCGSEQGTDSSLSEERAIHSGNFRAEFGENCEQVTLQNLSIKCSSEMVLQFKGQEDKNAFVEKVEAVYAEKNEETGVVTNKVVDITSLNGKSLAAKYEKNSVRRVSLPKELTGRKITRLNVFARTELGDLVNGRQKIIVKVYDSAAADTPEQRAKSVVEKAITAKVGRQCSTYDIKTGEHKCQGTVILSIRAEGGESESWIEKVEAIYINGPDTGEAVRPLNTIDISGSGEHSVRRFYPIGKTVIRELPLPSLNGKTIVGLRVTAKTKQRPNKVEPRKSLL